MDTGVFSLYLLGKPKLNFMKKPLLLFSMAMGLLALCALGQESKCPPANGSGQELVIQERANAVDFTTTFSDGVTTANLFNTLDAGNSVVLDFFYTT